MTALKRLSTQNRCSGVIPNRCSGQNGYRVSSIDIVRGNSTTLVLVPLVRGPALMDAGTPNIRNIKMTKKVITRDECPEPWFIGCQCCMAGEVLELIEIEGKEYTWIDVDTMDEKRLFYAAVR